MKKILEYLKVDLWINNQPVPTKHYKSVKDPGRLTDIVGEVAWGTVENVEQAVKAAYEAYKNWSKLDIDTRKNLLIKAAEKLEEMEPDLLQILLREQGMLAETIKGEIRAAGQTIRNTVELAEQFFKNEYYEDHNSIVKVEKRPIGVIAAIIPWNAPIILAMQKLAPALLAGNTIIFKPSPEAPLGVSTALMKISEIFPDGVINIIHGDGDVGSALTSHSLIRKISFTGGGSIAKLIMRDAAAGLKGVHFELGGNDPAIILDDANIEEIIPKMLPVVFRRSGQVCFAIKRIYVPESLYNTFYEIFCDHVNRYKIGHVTNEQTTFGPVNNERQFENVKALINRIKATSAIATEHGEILNLEEWNNGFYIRPVIVRDVNPNDEIVTCEQFGPVIPLVSYRNIEEVIEMANNSEYGLSSSIWSENEERAVRLSKMIESGMIYINGHGQTPLGLKYMPFGGVKQSGIGRENSLVGLSEFVEYCALNLHKKM